VHLVFEVANAKNPGVVNPTLAFTEKAPLQLVPKETYAL
jgi:hypothetical protein